MNDQNNHNDQSEPDFETETKIFIDKPQSPTEKVIAHTDNTPLSPEAATADLPPLVKKDTTEQATQVPTVAFEAPVDVQPSIRYGDVLINDVTTLSLRIGGDKALGTIETKITEKLIVGRAVEGDPNAPEIDLGPFNAYERGVSRQHVKIVRQGDTLYVVDLGSRNGTYLNGVRLHPNQARVLRDTDELLLGRLPVTIKLIDAESLDD